MVGNRCRHKSTKVERKRSKEKERCTVKNESSSLKHHISPVSRRVDRNLLILNGIRDDESVPSTKSSVKTGKHLCKTEKIKQLGVSTRNAQVKEIMNVKGNIDKRLKLEPEKSTKSKSKTYKCDHCDKIFTSAKELQKHVKTHTVNPLGLFICLKCNKSFKSKSSLSKHLKNHTQIQLPSNVRCANSSESLLLGKENLIEVRNDAESCDSDHSKTVFIESKDDILDLSDGCLKTEIKPKCRPESRKMQKLSTTDGDILEKEMECIVCHKIFPGSVALEQHMAIHSRKSANCDKHTVCHVCGKKLAPGSCLIKHMRTHTGEKPFCCDLCGTAFSEKGALTKHYITHTKEKKHFCQICGRGFGLRGQLTRHITSVHSGLKPYKCSACPFATPRRAALRIHFQRKHAGDNLKVKERVNCEICQKSVQKTYLDEHLKIHDDKLRKFQCSICKLAFTRKSILLRHVRTHAAPKPHKCDHEGCERAFNEKSDLTRHIRTVHQQSNKIYSCQVCSKRFSEKSQRDLHMSQHTGGYRYSCDVCGKQWNYRNRYLAHVKLGEKCKRISSEFECPDESMSLDELITPKITDKKQLSLNTPLTVDTQNPKTLLSCTSLLSPPLLCFDYENTSSSSSYSEPDGLLQHDELGEIFEDYKFLHTTSDFSSDIDDANSETMEPAFTNITEKYICNVPKIKFHKCDVCDNRYASLDDLQEHIQHHLKASMTPSNGDELVGGDEPASDTADDGANAVANQKPTEDMEIVKEALEVSEELVSFENNTSALVTVSELPSVLVSNGKDVIRCVDVGSDSSSVNTDSDLMYSNTKVSGGFGTNAPDARCFKEGGEALLVLLPDDTPSIVVNDT